MEEILPPKRKHRVKLSKSDKKFITSVLDDPGLSEERKCRAMILAFADERNGPAKTLSQIADEAGVGTTTVYVVTERFLAEGINAAVMGKRRGGARPNTGRGGCGLGQPRILGEEEESKIRKLYGTAREDGKAWTYDLLAEEFGVSHGTVGNVLRR